MVWRIQFIGGQRSQFWGLGTMPRRTRQRHIGKLYACVHAPSHKPTPAHIPAAGEFRWEEQPFAKDFEQRGYILGGCNAAEKNDLAVGSG